MKVSELIDQLRRLQAASGDLEVYYEDNEFHFPCMIEVVAHVTPVDLRTTAKLPPEPYFLIGGLP